MEQSTGTNPNPASFASLLASLAAPARKPEPEWNDDEPAEELVTLSYESALRAHARYRPAPDPLPLPARPPAQPPVFQTTPAAASFQPDPAPGYEPAPAAQAQVQAQTQTQAQIQRPLADLIPDSRLNKTASITIRMSEAECEQLRRRAAEAGMTISAYLRSCTFEAETLRAQVKQVMAELRAAATPPPTPRPEPAPAPVERHALRNVLERFMPHSQSLQHAVRAQA